MHRVWWQPPPHQTLTGGEHPTGHDCEVCTIHYPASVVARRLTLAGARRKAEKLNLWSLTPGHFYVFGDVRADAETTE